METDDLSWNVSKILDREPYAAIILNTPIDRNEERRICSFWRKASFRATVDGGTDRWKEFVGESGDVPDPDLISGDFDSVTQETLSYYTSRGTSSIVHTPDQNYTDFTKCLIEIKKRREDLNSFFVLAQHTGRLDQIFANVETLFHARSILGLDSSIYLVESNSISWLLKPGKYKIKYIPNKNKNYVGLIPVGAPIDSISTTGLRWNLDNGRLAFGKLVSTSNELDGNGTMTVKTTGDLLLIIIGMGI